jgi:hypothetical protein
MSGCSGQQIKNILKETGFDFESLPELDLKGQMGSTGYIDFLNHWDVSRSVMRFTDKIGRVGIVVRLRGKSDRRIVDKFIKNCFHRLGIDSFSKFFDSYGDEFVVNSFRQVNKDDDKTRIAQFINSVIPTIGEKNASVLETQLKEFIENEYNFPCNQIKGVFVFFQRYPEDPVFWSSSFDSKIVDALNQFHDEDTEKHMRECNDCPLGTYKVNTLKSFLTKENKFFELY